MHQTFSFHHYFAGNTGVYVKMTAKRVPVVSLQLNLNRFVLNTREIFKRRHFKGELSNWSSRNSGERERKPHGDCFLGITLVLKDSVGLFASVGLCVFYCDCQRWHTTEKIWILVTGAKCSCKLIGFFFAKEWSVGYVYYLGISIKGDNLCLTRFQRFKDCQLNFGVLKTDVTTNAFSRECTFFFYLSWLNNCP